MEIITPANQLKSIPHSPRCQLDIPQGNLATVSANIDPAIAPEDQGLSVLNDAYSQLLLDLSVLHEINNNQAVESLALRKEVEWYRSWFRTVAATAFLVVIAFKLLRSYLSILGEVK